MAEIIFTAGPYTGHKLEVPETGMIIGRAEEATLVLDDGQVSSKHAQIGIQEGAWCIYDLQSSNGTMVNGQPIQAVVLNNGDLIAIGDTQFTFNITGATIARQTLPQTPPSEPPPGTLQPEAPAAPAGVSATPAAQQPMSAAALLAGSKSAAKEVSAPNVVTSSKSSKEASSLSTGAKASEQDVKLVQQMSERTDRIRNEVGKVIVGQRAVLDEVLMCMIAGGHALLIGLPGMAKTLTVFTIAKVLDMQFKRVQFTPDLMPTDIIGSDVLETNKETNEKEFRFIKGPIFCNLLLADEINRTPPKTQAALLEAMQEKRVTAGNTTYTLDKPFFVLATQNPIEQEGTYPLPEAQLDRFMFNIWVDYPLQDEEEKVIGATTTGGLAEPQRVLTKQEVIQLQEVVRKIPVSDHVIKYIIRLVRATRPQYDDAPKVTKTYISCGAGPRAGQNLVLAAKARAVLEGRIHVSCNDIRKSAMPVLRHRIITNFSADSEGLTTVDIVKKILDEVKEPGEETYNAPPGGAKKAAVPAAATVPAADAKKKK
ncbi:MAG: AAA family ATPase [Kiritimatiellae bacterium]|nr:AAA family ATPase [Kiritimatiellia bacterium]MDD5522638.1 AAA family ATPase [Kiritimatiellia bacterium]